MTQKITLRRAIWAAMAGILIAGALAGPQAAFADGDKGKKGKDGKVPIVIGPIITTTDPPKKK